MRKGRKALILGLGVWLWAAPTLAKTPTVTVYGEEVVVTHLK